ncbi:MAG TPA: hypothetical protein DGJ56_10580 [Verrucomicrobiales bacterium]|nr:hypothetical protein [Verrucomicrobiales bacterium]
MQVTILPNCNALLISKFAINLANAKPNVLLIVSDDLNTHVSTSGYPHIKTPHLDRLAKAGVTFNRAYCQYPVCGPSRASFLSGLYPESSGVLNNKIDIRNTRPGTVSLPQFMKENGYWTGGVGKIFHSGRHEPGDLGWNENHRFENDEFPFVAEARKQFEAEHGSVVRGKTRRRWKKKLQDMFTQTRGQQQPGYGPSGLNDAQHRDGRNARKAVDWLDKKSFGDKPFSSRSESKSRMCRSSRRKNTSTFIPNRNCSSTSAQPTTGTTSRPWRWSSPSAVSASNWGGKTTRYVANTRRPTTRACRSWTHRSG